MTIVKKNRDIDLMMSGAPDRKASELTFPCCESRGGALGDKLWVN